LDPVHKSLIVKINPTALPWCEGKIPVGDQFVDVQWKQDANTLNLFVQAPDGFDVKIENQTGKELSRASAPLNLGAVVQ